MPLIDSSVPRQFWGLNLAPGMLDKCSTSAVAVAPPSAWVQSFWVILPGFYVLILLHQASECWDYCMYL